MLCFVGAFVRLVSRSDVVTAQPLGYLLTEREKMRREEKGGGGWTRKEKKKKKKSVKCESDCTSFTHFSVMHRHT